MVRRILRWSVLPLVIVAVVIILWHYTRSKPIEVSVKSVTRGTVERTVANTRAGTIKACRRAKLSPSVGGQIAKLPIKKGDIVKKGQLLLELWNEDLAAQINLAEHELASARSRSQSVCLKADLAQRNAKRMLDLRRSDVASEELADNAVSEAAALQAECKAARTEIAVRESQLSVVRANAERTQLTAPFDGVIAELNGELFEFVTPSPVGVATPPAVDIIDNSCFYVTAPIDEVDAADIRAGMTTRITMDAFKDKHFEGKVRRIADYVLDLEKQARTVDVEVDFVNVQDYRNLLPGYSADIEVILEVRHEVIRVPTEAVIEGRRIFVYLPGSGQLAQRDIHTGLSNWNWTEVMGGLQPGDSVVVNVDNPKLTDGVAVVLAKDQK